MIPIQKLPNLVFGFDSNFNLWTGKVNLISKLWSAFDDIFK